MKRGYQFPWSFLRDALVKAMEDTLNPFGATHRDDKLYCLSTGCATSPEVKNEPTDIYVLGTYWKDQFVSECKA